MINTDFRTAMREEFRLPSTKLEDDLLDRYFAQVSDSILIELLQAEDKGALPICDIYSHTTTASDTQELESSDKILWIDNYIEYDDGTDIVMLKKSDLSEIISSKDVKSLLSGIPCTFAIKDFQNIVIDSALPASNTIKWKGIKETVAISKIQTIGNFDNEIYERGKILVAKYLNLFARTK